MKTTVYCFIFLLVTINASFGQKKKDRKEATQPVKQELLTVEIALTARSYGDSVVLRWGYKEASAFRTLNDAGFIIERLSIDKDNKVIEENFVKLTPEPIKPWPLEEWENKGIENDDYAAVATQALYGKSFSVSEDLGEIAFMQNMADDAMLRHSFSLLAADISPLAANGLGLRYVDKNVDLDKKYIYRVYSLHDKTFFVSDTAMYIISVKDKYNPFPPSRLTAIEGDKIITLEWPQEAYFTAYNIEKSVDGGKTYKKLNEKPYIKISKDNSSDKMVYADSLKANYKPCLYRIAGISPFGDVSPWSDAVKVIGRDRTPPEAPVIKEAKYTKDKKVIIKWEMNEVAPDLMGYFVGTSSDVKGPFSPIHKDPLSKNTRTYTDNNPFIQGGKYYVVVSVDTALNVQQSMPAYVFTPDSIPPAKPFGLVGKIDTTGLAKISWNLGKEKDLQGYRVYFSNQADNTFMPLTGTIQDTTYTDTISLNTLNQYIYYRVVAVDNNFNNSNYSDVLQLDIPDKIPPVPPVFTKYLVTDSTVYLEWFPSGSKDVEKQILSRKEEGKEWSVLMNFDSKVTIYTDKNIVKNKKYEYSLRAIDNANLESKESIPVKVKIYDTGLRDEILDFKALLSQDKKSISISWQPLKDKNCNIIIYRSYNGNAMKMYTSIVSKEDEYKDFSIQEKGSYKYSIQAVYPDGGKSPITEIKEVVLD